MNRPLWIALALAFALGCSKGTGSTCPTNSTLTYDNFGRNFFSRYCDSCHGTGGRTRPSLASVTEIRARVSSVDQEAAAGPDNVNTSMPEGSPAPTEAERRQLGEWLACGAR
ncbi:MAG: hypothetical protein U0324_35385 [Polyangiales bacterium]